MTLGPYGLVVNLGSATQPGLTVGQDYKDFKNLSVKIKKYCPRASSLMSLSLSFAIYKMGKSQHVMCPI